MIATQKRGLVRFSLRTLFLVMALFALISPRFAQKYLEWKADRQHKADLKAIGLILDQTDSALYYYATEEGWEQSRRKHAEIERRLWDAIKKGKLKW